MMNGEAGTVLGFGALGLGLALGLLTIYLLHRITVTPRPHGPLLRTIKLFWFSSIVLMLVGIYAESTSSRNKLRTVEANILTERALVESERAKGAQLERRLEAAMGAIAQFKEKKWVWDTESVGVNRYQCRLDGDPVGEPFNCADKTLGTGEDACASEQMRQAVCALTYSKDGWKNSSLAQ